MCIHVSSTLTVFSGVMICGFSTYSLQTYCTEQGSQVKSVRQTSDSPKVFVWKEIQSAMHFCIRQMDGVSSAALKTSIKQYFLSTFILQMVGHTCKNVHFLDTGWQPDGCLFTVSCFYPREHDLAMASASHPSQSTQYSLTGFIQSHNPHDDCSWEVKGC